ncbi:MAG: hypothetical protein NVSMB66_6370 [Candidatus Doudnabacteria bacterium]
MNDLKNHKHAYEGEGSPHFTYLERAGLSCCGCLPQIHCELEKRSWEERLEGVRCDGIKGDYVYLRDVVPIIRDGTALARSEAIAEREKEYEEAIDILFNKHQLALKEARQEERERIAKEIEWPKGNIYDYMCGECGMIGFDQAIAESKTALNKVLNIKEVKE